VVAREAELLEVGANGYLVPIFCNSERM